VFYSESGEIPAQVARRDVWCSTPEMFQVRLDRASWRCPYSLQGGWTRQPSKVPSNASYSMSLWFYERIGIPHHSCMYPARDKPMQPGSTRTPSPYMYRQVGPHVQ